MSKARGPANAVVPTNVARVPHLNQTQLARRWLISPCTLERWRWLNQGPAYLKIGGRVVYPAADIEDYERTQRRGGPVTP